MGPTSGYDAFHPAFAYLFNSYYNSVGAQFPRPQRGLVSRPTVAEIWNYRQYVDDAMDALLSAPEACSDDGLSAVVALRLQHEQQHQELILTDIKHAFSLNPLDPTYREAAPRESSAAAELEWIGYEAGVYEIGVPTASQPGSPPRFSFDNESPRHRVFLEDRQLASRLVTCGEYRQFIADGGYQRPEFWLSAGWHLAQQQGWRAPLYWRQEADGNWSEFTLAGRLPVVENAPVCHVSYFEADAFARWAGKRLPTEFEWEAAADAAHDAASAGNFVDDVLAAGRSIHPTPLGERTNRSSPAQLWGDVWEWTASQYLPYPGYAPASGALGEYNGKFMCNQFVLRGGSCATSRSHIRTTYRNFFPPEARWQFSGIRLAQS
ncbi:MAG: ergothioneine biosynthesis protein EgtB [Planctomycetales bacterium]|nr:ergothioneine biosynthesis protein EgtB [Planctomycetales bacterium]